MATVLPHILLGKKDTVRENKISPRIRLLTPHFTGNVHMEDKCAENLGNDELYKRKSTQNLQSKSGRLCR